MRIIAPIGLMPDPPNTLMNYYPNIEVSAEVADWATLQHKIIDGDLDFAIIGKHIVPPDAPLETRLILVEEAGWYVRTGHPLTKNRTVSIRELPEYPLVSVPLPPSTRVRLERRMGLAPGETLRLGLQCNDLYALREVVLQSNAILSATTRLCRREVAAGLLTRLNLRDNMHTVEIAVTKPIHRELSQAAHRAITVIQQLAARH